LARKRKTSSVAWGSSYIYTERSYDNKVFIAAIKQWYLEGVEYTEEEHREKVKQLLN